MDWGLARKVRGAELPIENDGARREGTVLQTMVGSILGTPFYMSPEQARGENDSLDERSDVYSLCVVFHELLHLKHYLQGREKLEEVIDGVQHAKPPLHMATWGTKNQVPAELDWFLERGLRKDKAERWQSVAEMESELQRIIRGECRVQCQRTFLKRMMGESRTAIDRHPFVVIVGSTALASVVLAAVVKSVMVLVG